MGWLHILKERNTVRASLGDGIFDILSAIRLSLGRLTPGSL